MRSAVLSLLLLMGVCTSAHADLAPGSFQVPYKLTLTNHIMVRLKLNGKGPYNFILDTGAPTLIVTKEVGEAIGVKAPAKPGWSTLDTMDVEGGVSLKQVKCIIETPYQIEGMNALGVSGVKLDGLMGYSVVSRFRIDIDLSKDKLVWTPVNSTPINLERHRGKKSATTKPAGTGKAGATGKATTAESADEKADADKEEADEASLEMTGTLMKALGPLFHPKEVVFQPQGFVGIGLDEAAGAVSVAAVLGDGPADRAGIEAGDRILTVDAEPVKSMADVQKATAKLHVGQAVCFGVERDHHTINFVVTAEPGL